MKPVLEFDPVWSTAPGMVNSIRLYGHDHEGKPFERYLAFPRPVSIEDVHKMVAKINNNEVRFGD